jgi:DNA-binding transcriptional regulator YdaS (Cro superfamily)
MELAAEMPAVVLSKLLGISPSSATQWTEFAGASAAGRRQRCPPCQPWAALTGVNGAE